MTRIPRRRPGRRLTVMVARSWRATVALLVAAAVATGTVLAVAELGLHPTVLHEAKVRIAILQLHEGMLDEETGLRGYLLTGDREFLQPYDAGRRLVTAALPTLHDDPTAAPMVAAAELWMDEWAQPAHDILNQDSPGLDLFLKDGKQLLDAYRKSELAAFQHTTQRIDRLDADILNLLWVGFGVVAAILVVAVVGGYSRYRALRGAIVQPVEQLLASMHAYERGGTACRLDAAAPEELRALDERLAAMTDELARARETELAAKAARATALAGHAEQLAGVVRLQHEIATVGLAGSCVLQVAVDRARELTGADASVVELVRGERLVYEATSGAAAGFVGMSVGIDASLSGQCARSGEVIRCDDTEADPRVDLAAARRVGARSMLVVPLRDDAGVVGVLKVYADRVAAFDDDHTAVLKLVGGFIAVSLRHAEQYAEKVRLIESNAHAEEALRESEERFRSTFDNAPIGKSIVGRNARIQRVNAKLAEILGGSAADFVGLDLFELVVDADRSVLRNAVAAVSSGNAATWEIEVALRHRAGGTVHAFVTGSLVREATGAPMHFIVQFQDITARREMERRVAALLRELEQRAGELERSNRDLSQFAYVASHDLAEPLRVIKGFTGLLLDELEVPAASEAAAYAGHITEGVGRMQALLAGLLAYSRAGSTVVRHDAVDWGELAQFVLADLATAIAESGATVSIGDLPVVTGDPTLLRQLLQNLVANAVKFVPDGVTPRIEVDGEEFPDQWEIRVVDHGIGIPAEYRPRIFGMFQRLHARDEYAGTGIGLAVAARIVDRHGGELAVDDPPGGGATFRIRLPRPTFDVELPTAAVDTADTDAAEVAA